MYGGLYEKVFQMVIHKLVWRQIAVVGKCRRRNPYYHTALLGVKLMVFVVSIVAPILMAVLFSLLAKVLP